MQLRPPASRAAGRRHRLLPNGADSALVAVGPSLEDLFEEVALAFGELTGSADPAGAIAGTIEERRIELEAPDMAALAVGWLTELIAQRGPHRLVVGATVDDLGCDVRADRAFLRATVRLRRVAEAAGGVKAVSGVTCHRLELSASRRGWRLAAALAR